MDIVKTIALLIYLWVNFICVISLYLFSVYVFLQPDIRVKIFVCLSTIKVTFCEWKIHFGSWNENTPRSSSLKCIYSQRPNISQDESCFLTYWIQCCWLFLEQMHDVLNIKWWWKNMSLKRNFELEGGSVNSISAKVLLVEAPSIIAYSRWICMSPSRSTHFQKVVYNWWAVA